MIAFIPSPPSNGLHLGPVFVHAYGVAYIVAVLAAIVITSRRWRAVGGDPALVQEVALWAFPAGLIGGRLYFLATSWNEVPDHWWGPLAVWDGGLGIWGGIAAGTLVGIWVLRRRHADIPLFLDAAAPALLVAQAIGRVGNYFNQELFGGPTTLPWGLEIDPAHRPAAYAQYATFHPTFLYELMWNLLLAAALVELGRRPRSARPASSRSTSRATRWAASARSCCALTRRTTSSDCGSISSSRRCCLSPGWHGSPRSRQGEGSAGDHRAAARDCSLSERLCASAAVVGLTPARPPLMPTQRRSRSARR